MKRVAITIFALAVVALAAACSHSRFSSDPTVDCGEPGASNECRAATQPRLIVSFGDAHAASFTYTAIVDGADDDVTEAANVCLNPELDDPGLRCDASFYAIPASKQITLMVGFGEAGPPLATRVIALTPFNYCGDGAAQVVVTTSNDGTPVIAAPTFRDICSRDVVPY